MRRERIQFLPLALLVLAGVFSPAASAEIYKWVDEEGNVHFGDRAVDAAKAKNGHPLELKPSYVPTQRTAEEQQAQQQEQEALSNESNARRREKEKAQAESMAAAEKDKATRCAGYAKQLEQLTSVSPYRGRLLFHYALDENGESVTEERQQEIVQELRDKQAAEGCA